MNRDEFLKYTGGRGMYLEAPECDLYLGVDFDQETNTMFAGYVSNVGVCRNVELPYDDDFSIDENLQNLYDIILVVFNDEINCTEE